MSWLCLLSPAKVNLQLAIMSKGADGYHQLSSLMQTLHLSDGLRMRSGPEDRFVYSDSSLPQGQANLLSQAVRLFRQKSGYSLYIEAFLEKNIPVEAGLGGGSSNAATALFGCNQLAKQAGYPAVSEEILLRWAGEIGADVPFFFSLGSACCEGRGERVYRIPFPGKTSVWIAKPPFGLSTREVFQSLDLQSLRSLARQPIWYNDLEIPAFSLRPELALFKREAEAQGSQVVMTGSGSAFVVQGPLPPIPKDWRVWKTDFAERQPGAWYAGDFTGQSRYS